MAKYIGKGMTLGVDKTGSGTYTVLAQLNNISGPSKEVGSIEVTDLSSTAKEYIPGLPDSGEISAELQFDPANTTHTYLLSLTDAPEVLSWQITIPTTPASMFTSDGFVTSFEIDAGGNEEVLTGSVTIKLTGAVVLSVASGG